MEWIIGLIVVWVVWRFLTGRARREATLKGAIHRAYIASTKLGQEWIDTPIYWEAAERFAQDRSADLYRDGSPAAHFNMLVNGEEVSVILMRNSMNGTTQVSARRKEDIINSGKAYIDELLKTH